MVALGWGGSPTDVARDLPGALSALFDLPGARYLLVVEESGDGDRVRAELGGAPEADLAVLTWARRVAGVAHERGNEFTDVVLTTASAFHLVRPLPADRWVVLRLDREEGNLAVARRALAAAAAPGRLALERPAPGRPAIEQPASGRPAPDRSGLRRLPSTPGPTARSTGARPLPPDRLGTPDQVGLHERPAASFRPEPTRIAPVSRPTPTATPSVIPAAMPGALPAGPDPVRPAAPEPAPAPRQSGDATLPRGPRPTPVPELPGPPRSRPGVPALAFLPASASPAGRVVDVPDAASTEPAPGDPLPRRVRATDATADPGTPVVPPTSGTPDGAVSSASMFTPSAETGTAPATGTDDLVVGTARRPLQVRQARVLRSPAPEVPPAREPADERPAPEIPAPRSGSLFAPVVVVPPPPSPVDDDTTEVPAPVPYPIITAPPLEPPAAEPAAEDAAETEPDPEPEVTPAGLPRRVPGTHLAVPAPPPAPAPTPAGIPGWNTEVSVLRRLLTGLRRLS